jgi:hypothetical protein
MKNFLDKIQIQVETVTIIISDINDIKDIMQRLRYSKKKKKENNILVLLIYSCHSLTKNKFTRILSNIYKTRIN